jgi:hypothetical protein
MYGLNKDVDVSFLLNRELIQLCIGLYQAILRFDDAVDITLDCEFHLNPGLEVGTAKDPARMRFLDLASLLGSPVSEVRNPGDGTLCLQFSNGSTLEIVDSNPNHESFTITTRNQLIVV